MPEEEARFTLRDFMRMAEGEIPDVGDIAEAERLREQYMRTVADTTRILQQRRESERQAEGELEAELTETENPYDEDPSYSSGPLRVYQEENQVPSSVWGHEYPSGWDRIEFDDGPEDDTPEDDIPEETPTALRPRIHRPPRRITMSMDMLPDSSGIISYTPATPSRPRTFICTDCRNEYPRSIRTTDLNGRLVCQECFQPWEYCRSCDSNHLISDMVEIWYGSYECFVCNNCAADDQRVRNCTNCDVRFLRRRNEDLCNPCERRISIACTNCGELTPRERAVASRQIGGWVCPSCSRRSSNPVEYEISGGETREVLPYGIEIEAEFRGECPIPLSGYHHHAPTPHHLLRGWRAETDSSLRNGGEFISPPLTGVEGMAEVMWTYGVLAHNEARIYDSCGQHITIGVRNSSPDFGARVQLLTMALEESLFALGGNLQRCIENRYCLRIKRHPTDRLLNEKEINPERRLPAYIKGTDLVEFRYPPGTLEGVDLAINLGITQLIMQIASEIDEEELDALARRTLSLNTLASEGTVTHQRVIMGLEFLREYGWKAEGEFQGLPYNPYERITIHLVDNAHGHTGEITLPSADDIVERMKENLSGFYDMGIGFFDNVDEQYKEAMEVICVD